MDAKMHSTAGLITLPVVCAAGLIEVPVEAEALAYQLLGHERDLPLHAERRGEADEHLGVVEDAAWLDPSQGFISAVVPVFTGDLPTFAAGALFQFADVDPFPAGSYLWFALVDDVIDGVPSGSHSDFVLIDIK